MSGKNAPAPELDPPFAARMRRMHGSRAWVLARVEGREALVGFGATPHFILARCDQERQTRVKIRAPQRRLLRRCESLDPA